jgi:hypothetical protein
MPNGPELVSHQLNDSGAHGARPSTMTNADRGGTFRFSLAGDENGVSDHVGAAI